jgi:pilus assembly protein CpaB
LVVAAMIAVLGSAMVFLYVKSADDRASERLVPVQVLKAKVLIEPGETMTAAMQAGKIDEAEVPQAEVIEGAVSSVSAMADQVALQKIYPGEQIVTAKFGSPGDQEVLSIPDGQVAISVSLSDTGRVSGFVSPGSDVAIFLTSPAAGGGVEGTRLLLPKVKVIAVGATTVTTTTTTTGEAGTATTEQLPKTLFTLAASQPEAERIMFAATNGELSFALLTDKSKVAPGPAVTEQNLFTR